MGYNPICAKCPFDLSDRKCMNEKGRAPADCPTENFAEKRNEIIRQYTENDMFDFYLASSDSGGKIKTRIQETLDVAQKMRYKKIGIAFCSGLRNEAGKISRFFEMKGFKVASVICKCGSILKKEIDSKASGKDGEKSFCNPCLQAAALNKAETEWNIVVGLCVGHDSIFMKYSDAMCTVLAAKDKVTGHNPLGPVYTMDSYYSFLKK